jgi:hypothetical protein
MPARARPREPFGKYLARHEIVTPKQLEDATQTLVIFGGRLGSNLVELGHLDLDDLERHLSAYMGVQMAPARWVERPDPRALKALKPSVIERHRIMPLEIEAKTLHVAMQDPSDAAQIDDLAFASGLSIEPYLMSEIRLGMLLESHFGIRRNVRYINLGPDDVVAPGKGPEAAGPGEVPAAPSVSEEREAEAREREAHGIHPLEAHQELIDEEAFSDLHSSFQAGTGAEAPASVARAEVAEPPPAIVQADPAAGDAGRDAAADAIALETALAAAPDRDAVTDIALRLARIHVRAAALFVVHRDVIHGAAGAGCDLERRVRGVFLPCEGGGLLAEVAASGNPFRGRPPRTGVDDRLFRALGREGAREAAVLPIEIGGRVVNLLYVDDGPEFLAETAVGALAALSGCVSTAYERLIVARRNRHC